MGIDLYLIFIYPLIYIWPAYVANGAPVILGGGKPLDFGRKFMGKPIFGSHKTIRGLFAGLAAGFIMAGLESIVFPYMLPIGILLSVGTMFGDLFGSFIKRRMGTGEGTKMLFLDQYPFVIFAMLFALPLGHTPSIPGIIFILLLTGALHVLTNHGAHKMKLKKVPW